MRNLTTYTGMTASDAGDPIQVADGSLAAVHALSGGGTGFNSGTLTIQGSLDGTNWFTLRDVAGTDVTFTAEAYFEICTAVSYIRPLCDASIGDVDVHIVV